jgi:hypothetical protein
MSTNTGLRRAAGSIGERSTESNRFRDPETQLDKHLVVPYLPTYSGTDDTIDAPGIDAGLGELPYCE